MSLQIINKELLKSRGFIVTSAAGSGAMGEVYKGICNEKAYRLVKTDSLQTDSENSKVVIIENQTFRKESISGMRFAVKCFDHKTSSRSNTSSRISQFSLPASHSTVSLTGFPEWGQNISPSHSGSTISLSGFPEWGQNISPSHSGSTISLSGFPEWGQNISPTHSRSGHSSPRSVPSQPDPYAAAWGQLIDISKKPKPTEISQTGFPESPQNISPTHSRSGHLSPRSVPSQPDPFAAAWGQLIDISKKPKPTEISQTGFPESSQNISPTHSRSGHSSPRSVPSQPDPFAAAWSQLIDSSGKPKPSERSLSGSTISLSGFPEWGQNISPTHSGSGHLSLSRSAHSDRGENDLPTEASIHLGLNHENIVQIYDVVNDSQNGRFYIVMELLEMSLKDYLEKTDLLSLDQFYDFVTQLLNGSDYLHSKDIYHNDVHELNIMIKKTKEGVILKYVDFGFSTYDPIKSFPVKNYTFRDISGLAAIFDMIIDRTLIDDDLDYENGVKGVFKELSKDMMLGIYETVEDVRADIQALIEIVMSGKT